MQKVKRDTLVVVLSLTIIATLTLLVSLVCGVAEKEKELIFIRKIDFKLESVNDTHADINFIVTVQRTKKVTNATLLVFVHDKLTNILLKKKELKIPREGKEGLDELKFTLSFEKDRDYKVILEIRKNNKIVSTRGLILKGLSTLIPKEKELKVYLKDVDFEVLRVFDNKVEVKTRFYLESMDDYTIIFHIKAVQYESNILASDKWLQEEIRKGKTVLVETNLTIPKDYNYLIKIEAWKANTLVKSWSKPLNLAPTRKIPANVTEEKVRFEVSEFIREEKVPGYIPTPIPVPTPLPFEKVGVKKAYKPLAAPGFELVMVLIVIGGLILWKKRNRV